MGDLVIDGAAPGGGPFANTTNDASLPELAQFLCPQGGKPNAEARDKHEDDWRHSTSPMSVCRRGT